MIGRLALWLSVAALVPAGSPAPVAPQSTPPLATILDKVIARDAATQEALKSMEYHQTMTTERLDGQDKVTQLQEVRMVVRPGAPNEIEVVSEKGDDLPMNPDQASLQAQGKRMQKQKFDFPMKEMVKRFNITLAGQSVVDGQDTYILEFEPKPDQPYRNQLEKVLNHLRGRTWISTRDYSVLKTDATLAEPVNVAWIFAQITALTFHYDLKNTSGGMGPAQVRTSVQVNAPLISIRQRTTIDLTQFGPRAKT